MAKKPAKRAVKKAASPKKAAHKPEPQTTEISRASQLASLEAVSDEERQLRKHNFGF